jgi:hypothetical protein
MTLKLKLNPEREIRHVSEGFVFLGVFFNPSFGVEPTQFFLSKSEFDNISAC